MRRVNMAPAAVLLAGPIVLAFFSGGYFERPRLIAGLAACVLVLVAVVRSPRPLPRARAPRMALGGLALLTAWTGASIAWAPLGGPAGEDLQRLLLYLAALFAAAALLRGRRLLRWVEPVLAAGIACVLLYGLSDRLLPGVVSLSHTFSAGGRLDEPLTYWNAMGIEAALGFVLLARLAGDRTRPPGLRTAALALAVPVGLALYLTFSRGALAALATGLIVLFLAAPDRPQLRAIALALGAAALTVAPANALRAVETLGGDAGTRRREGLLMLAVIVVLMAASALVGRGLARREEQGRLSVARIPLSRGAYRLASLLVVVVISLFVIVAVREHNPRPSTITASPARLSSVHSNRYAYWRVAVRAFGAQPLRGVGSSGFRTRWLRERPFREPARDAHSLYLETAAELGLVGLLALALLFGGAGAAARTALRRDRALCAGACAALAAWTVHAGIDWDWEMPAVSLLAVILAGALLGVADELDDAPAALG